jgi:hypothetical protein
MVRQPLAFRSTDRNGCPFPIFNSKLGTVVISKIKFGQISMQMLFSAMLVRAFHSAFEN